MLTKAGNPCSEGRQVKKAAIIECFYFFFRLTHEEKNDGISMMKLNRENKRSDMIKLNLDKTF